MPETPSYGSSFNPDQATPGPGQVTAQPSAPQSAYDDPRYQSIQTQIDAAQTAINGYQARMNDLRKSLANPPATNAKGEAWDPQFDGQNISAEIKALESQVAAASQNLNNWQRQRNDFLDSWDKQHPQRAGDAPETEAARDERLSRDAERAAQARAHDAQAAYDKALAEKAGNANDPDVKAAKIALDNAQADAASASAAHSRALTTATAADTEIKRGELAIKQAAAPVDRSLTAAQTANQESATAANTARTAQITQEMQQKGEGELVTLISQLKAGIQGGTLGADAANLQLSKALGYGTPAERAQYMTNARQAAMSSAAQAGMLVPQGFREDAQGNLARAFKGVGIDYRAPTTAPTPFDEWAKQIIQAAPQMQGGFDQQGNLQGLSGAVANQVGQGIRPEQVAADPAAFAGWTFVGGPLHGQTINPAPQAGLPPTPPVAVGAPANPQPRY